MPNARQRRQRELGQVLTDYQFGLANQVWDRVSPATDLTRHPAAGFLTEYALK